MMWNYFWGLAFLLSFSDCTNLLKKKKKVGECANCDALTVNSVSESVVYIYTAMCVCGEKQTLSEMQLEY